MRLRLPAEVREVGAHPRLRTLAAVVTSLCGGLLLVILFFALMGAIDPGEALGLSIVAVVFAAVWFMAFLSRHADEADQKRVDWRDRERRGF